MNGTKDRHSLRTEHSIPSMGTRTGIGDVRKLPSASSFVVALWLVNVFRGIG